MFGGMVKGRGWGVSMWERRWVFGVPGVYGSLELYVVAASGASPTQPHRVQLPALPFSVPGHPSPTKTWSSHPSPWLHMMAACGASPTPSTIALHLSCTWCWSTEPAPPSPIAGNSCTPTIVPGYMWGQQEEPAQLSPIELPPESSDARGGSLCGQLHPVP